jgi:hypothetical protein
MRNVIIKRMPLLSALLPLAGHVNLSTTTMMPSSEP